MRYLVVLLLTAYLSACDSANNQRPSAQYEEKKKSLEDIERENPLQFLKIQGDHHINLVNQAVIEGAVKNTATIAAYKDIEIKITYKDKSGANIEKDIKTLNNIINPGETEDFKIKTRKPKGTSSVQLDITGATADK